MDITTPLSTLSNWKLEKKCIVGGPVTCVKFLVLGASDDEEESTTCCLVAKGPYLQEIRESSCRRSLLVFAESGGSIHRVSTTKEAAATNQFLVVSGGRQVALVDPVTFQKIPIDKHSNDDNILCLSDWIWDVRIRQTQTSDVYQMAVGLANNASEIWQMDRSDSTAAVRFHRLQRIVSTVRCITYCMAFHGWEKSDSSSLTIASGTVFNEILLWTVADNESSGDDDAVITKPVEHKLKGHEGVLLSLKFNVNGNRLASTSDDRSVRVWSRSSSNMWSQLWVGWGHSARVWNVCFSSNDNVISTGEDGTARLWKGGNQIGQWRHYGSQSIWRVDVNDDVAALGTNNGMVQFWHLSSCHNDSIDSAVSILEVPDDRPVAVVVPSEQVVATEEEEQVAEKEPDTPSAVEDAILATKAPSEKKKKKKKSKPKVVSQAIFGMDFYRDDASNDDSLIIGTRCGTLQRYSFRDSLWKEPPQQWHHNGSTIKATDANSLAISASHVVAIGTTRGSVLLTKLQTSASTADESVVADGQVFKAVQGLRWIQADILVSFHIKGIIVLWNVTDSASLLSVTKHHVLDTTTGVIPTSLFMCGSRFVAGDSKGNIALFNVSDNDENTILPATNVCLRVHAKEHVNDIISWQDNRFVSVGNDGCICHCVITNDGTKLVRGASLPVAGLSSASRVWVNDTSGSESSSRSILVSGYYGNTFRVINFTHGYEVMSFETGGRQRQLSHTISSSSDHFAPQHATAVCASRKDGRNNILLCSNLKKLNVPCSWARTTHGVALHGEPVYDACLFTTHDEAHYAALLTGSEDCTARLSFLVDGNVACSLPLPPQESCVRAVAVSRKPKSSCSLMVVCGGKLEIDFHLVEDGARDNAASFCRGVVFMRQIGKGRYHDKADIDHRINAVQAVPRINSNGGSSHLVVTGDSNGSIVCFIVHEDDKQRHGYHVQGTVLTTQARPILALDIVSWGSHYLIFSGTTSGDVSVWVLPMIPVSELTQNSLAPLAVIQAHQMGTNSICTSIFSTSPDELRLLVGSVGDDQALTIMETSFRKDGCGQTTEEGHGVSFELMSQTTTSEAGISALKGVHFISQTEVVCTGYGQSLSVWSWQTHEAKHLLQGSVPVDVSDVNCLAFCKDAAGRLLAAVGGEGIEVMELQTLNSTLEG